jgi:two-component system, chemotaxis family, CheB/CheR fusion protein
VNPEVPASSTLDEAPAPRPSTEVLASLSPLSLPPFSGTVVALGASAGGLDALDRFFEALPAVPDATFVVVQHLAPEHKTMMDTLLARHTQMPVQVAQDGTAVQAAHVYVIPPGKTMTIKEGRLHIAPRPVSGVMLPIDAFFESLALERAPRAIGIVLSGTGSDGSRGAQALELAGGWVLAQDPESAKFDGMPRSVIATGVVHQVMPPEALALEVQTIVTHGEPRPALRDLPAANDPALTPEATTRLLTSVMRVDFAQYKPTTLMRRLQRRLDSTGVSDMGAYAELLAQRPDEVEVLRKELLIPVTAFFRDPEAFIALRDRALRPLLDLRVAQGQTTLRVWVTACSTGEEAYSITALLMELLDELPTRIDLKVFATDLEASYVERAATGRFEAKALDGLPPSVRERWFKPVEDGQWQVRPELRQRIIFSRHDLLADAPFTQLDLVTCRNMLIYLRPAAQDRVIRRLAYALRAGGCLFLGSSESPAAATADFEVIDARAKIYRLIRHTTGLQADDFLPARASAGQTARWRGGSADDARLWRLPQARALMEMARQYGPPSMLVTPQRELVHLFGDVESMLRFRPGAVSLDVLQLLPQELMPVVATLLHGAAQERLPQRSRLLRVTRPDGRETDCHVAVWPIIEEARVELLLVSFEGPSRLLTETPASLDDVQLAALNSSQIADLERELAATRLNLHDTIQELATANEELQASNEELMASNEELQSTNEELQSVNEELHTVNAEYQGKIGQLNTTLVDLEGLTQAARLPIVFLDEALRLVRFTPEAALLFRVRDGDLGRPLADLSHSLRYPDMQVDLSAALRGLVPLQREVQDQDGRWWLVSVMPVGSGGGLSSQPSRVVMTFVNVSGLHDLRRLQSVLDALPAHVALLDDQGVIRLVNRPWRDFASRNGDPGLTRTGVGVDYLAVCRSAAANDTVAARAADGLAAVLARSKPGAVVFYPCHSPDEERWFVMHATPLDQGGCVVMHYNLTGWVDPAKLAGRPDGGAT